MRAKRCPLGQQGCYYFLDRLSLAVAEREKMAMGQVIWRGCHRHAMHLEQLNC
jgi:hypothetical protein